MRSCISNRFLSLSALFLVALLSVATPVVAIAHHPTITVVEQPVNIPWD
jgi:hypothetical protein